MICTNLDFDTDAESNPLPAGTVVADQWIADGITLACRNRRSSHPDACLIFDSADPTGGDTDLGTPNADFGGPGEGSGGAAGALGENSTALGKVLVIAEDVCDADADGLVDDPDDEAAGGKIVAEFDPPVLIQTVTLVDIDEDESGGVLVVVDGMGAKVELPIEPLGNNSTQTIAVDVPNVVKLKVKLPSSGALADISYCTDDGGMCVPTSCEAAGARCGVIDDGCGGTIDCGECICDACISAVLTATLEQAVPPQFTQGEAALCRAIEFVIPASINVLGGATTHSSELTVEDAGVSFTCRYEGVAGDPRHRFAFCDNGAAAGSLAEGDYFRLRILDTGPPGLSAEIAVTIEQFFCM